MKNKKDEITAEQIKDQRLLNLHRYYEKALLIIIYRIEAMLNKCVTAEGVARNLLLHEISDLQYYIRHETYSEIEELLKKDGLIKD